MHVQQRLPVDNSAPKSPETHWMGRVVGRRWAAGTACTLRAVPVAKPAQQSAHMIILQARGIEAQPGADCSRRLPDQSRQASDGLQATTYKACSLLRAEVDGCRLRLEHRHCAMATRA